MRTAEQGHSAPVFEDSFTQQLEILFRWRRDVRTFRPDPVPLEILEELFALACLSPSVGYSQPWRFVLVESADRRRAVRENFLRRSADALADYTGERARLYAKLKLAGLDTAPVHLAVFTDRSTSSGQGLGQKTMPGMLDHSTAMAIFAFWLAARSRGIGVGWVSILEPTEVSAILAVPENWALTGYLCVGYPEQEACVPELERCGWERRDARARVLTRR